MTKKWSDVPAATIMKKYVDAAGTYIFVITNAWDSIKAPAGSYDASRGRYIGLHVEVVGPSKSIQMGRIMPATKLWINSDKAQSQAKGVIERLGLSIDPSVGAEDPLSVSEFVGRYFLGMVTEKPAREGSGNGQQDDETSGKRRFNFELSPFNITESPEGFTNALGVLTIDEENEISVKYYRDMEERSRKRSGDRSSIDNTALSDDLSDNEIPF